MAAGIDLGPSGWDDEPEWDKPPRRPPRRERRGAEDYAVPLAILLVVAASFLLGLAILAFSLAWG